MFFIGGLEDLVRHGLRALRETLPVETELTNKNCSLGIVGKDMDFTIYDDREIDHYVSFLEPVLLLIVCILCIGKSYKSMTF